MSRADRPNVVFLFSDQHRADAMGCSGHSQVQTPNLDRLAADGTRFSRAYCPAPICGPCRSALMTGRHVHRTGALTHRHMQNAMGLPTLPEAFRQAGYVTGAFGKVHCAGESDDRDLGFDERGLRIYTPMQSDYQHAVGLEAFWEYCSYLPQYQPDGATPRNVYNPQNAPINLPDELVLDAMVADRSLDFLERHQGRPFFLWAGLEKPHTEWYAPHRFHERYDPAQIELPDDIWQSHEDLPDTIKSNPRFPILTRERYTDEELRCCMAAYFANVTYMDEQAGRILDALDRLGLTGNTLVVYSSDHGENLFNHRMVHKHCFFETAVNVPLIARLPGSIAASEGRSQLVNLVDLFPTMADFCRLSAPDGLDGKSLRNVLENPAAPWRDATFSEFYEWGVPERMVRTDRWKYVHSRNDTHQLYDLQEDPAEQVNLALDPGHAELCRELNERVLAGWGLEEV